MRKSLSILMVFVMAATLLLTACGGTPTAVPATAVPATEVSKPSAPEAIDIGASVPLTGKYGALGAMVKPGYEYAVADINAAGGVYVKEYDAKIPLRLTIYDDESDPTKAVSKMETLFSEQGVVAYLGGAGSDMHAATAAIAEKNKTPYLGIAFALWQIHQQGYQYLFSPFPKSPAQANDVYEILNATIPEGERPTKVAIFQEKTDWGIELGGLWKENAAKYGYEVVAYEEYAPKSPDFSDIILKAQAAGAEALFAVPSPPDGLAIQKQMAELGWTPKFSLIIRAPENVSWAETLGTTGDYVTIFPGWHNAENFPGVGELNAKYQAEFGRPADLLTGPAYACVQILADAITRAGSLDRDAIRDAIAATYMTTVTGPVTFNADGTGKVLNPLVQWQNGKLELVWPLDQASAELAYPAPAFDQRTEVPQAEEGGIVAVCLPALDNPLMLALRDAFVNTFGDKYDVQTASADGNPNAQATQVENYTAMKAKMLFVMAVEASSLLPKLEAARAAGVKVMVVGGEPGASGRDAVMKLDQFLSGEYAALMAKKWVDATYPDAAEGSIETAVFTSSLNPEAIDRSNGLLMISEPYLKNSLGEYIDATGTAISDAKGSFLSGKSEADRVPNPAYSPAVKIVQTPAAEMFQAGQTAMQNVLTTNPNVKLVIAYASDGGNGASKAIMDEYAKGATSVITDLSKVAVFGVGMFGPEGDAIKESGEGKGVFRGAVAFGGPDLPGSTVAIAAKILNGEEFPEVTWDPMGLATLVNGELVIQPMANSGVLTDAP